MSVILREGTPSAIGGCNFCHQPNHHNTVLEIASDDPTCVTEIRFCLPCFLSAVQQVQNKKVLHG